MSRAYRIQVKESVRKVIRAEDHVSTRLEVLDILPCDQMSEMLATELEKQGFERDGDTMKRVDGETQITIDLNDLTVEVRRESEKEVTASGSREGRGYDDVGPNAKKVRENLSEQLKKDLEDDVSGQEKSMQSKLTDQLERELAGLRKELDQAVNRTTAEALKQKAAKLGQIKELTEDPETGSMTIVVEV